MWRRGLGAAVAIGCVLNSTGVSAQYLEPLPPRFVRDRNIPVGQRTVPGYEQLGIRLGQFNLYPSAAISAEYSDNVFAQETMRLDDVALQIAPQLRLTSDWPNHKLSLKLGAQIDRYAELTSENAERFDADAAALVQVSRNTVVRARARWQHLQEARTSQDVFVQTVKPLEFDVAFAALGVSHDFNRVRLLGEAAVIKTDYSNGVLFDGTPVDTRGRDNITYSMRGRVEYAQSPAISYFVQGTVNRRNFRAPLALEPARDSRGYELLVGVNFEPGALARGEIGIGYLRQNFDSPFFRDYGSLGVNARVQMFPTQLTTVSFEADRRIENSGNPDSSSYLSTTTALRVDHELLRTLILSATAEYQKDNFKDIDRNDRRIRFGLRAEHRFNRYLAVNAGVSHRIVRSTGLNRFRSYSESQFLVGISIRR